MKRRRAPEHLLVTAVVGWLKRKGLAILEEVRLQPHSIDIVALNPLDLSLMAFEVKVTNWRKALRQSALNREFVDFSFVAVPSRVAQRILSQSDADSRIGILSIAVGPDRIRISLTRAADRNGERPNRHYKRLIYRKFANRYARIFSK